MMLVRPPAFIRWWFFKATWHMERNEKNVYLTFDDGPTKNVTEWVLEILKAEDVKATFFCIGRNVERNKDIYNKILEQGHCTGNHTYSHLNGLKTMNKNYSEDISLASQYIQSNLFRPPYGQIKRKQLKEVGLTYKPIMWDVLSYDFSKKITPEKCLENVVKHTKNGSVIVFHDSLKAQKNLEYTLPRYIKNLKERGFNFKTITK